MSVEVSEKPGVHQNVDLGDGKSRTVVGAQLKITLTDSKGARNPVVLVQLRRDAFNQAGERLAPAEVCTARDP